MLKIISISKSFRNGRYKVLDDLSFNLSGNKVFALFGRNGSGKSTLFKILFGTMQAGYLDCEIDGVKYKPKSNIRLKLISFLPQKPFLPSHLHVADVFEMMITEDRAIAKVYACPGLKTLSDLRISQLSAGQRKYVEFLCIFFQPHPICFLDEPFAMVEPIYKGFIKDIIKKNKLYKQVIVSDHYYEDVLQICDEIFLIKDGKVIKIDDVKGLAEHGYLPKSRGVR